MTTILITGITGFLGTNLVKYFASNPEVRIFGHSRDKDSASKKFEGLPVQWVDSYEADRLNRLNIDIFIHLAGIAHDLSNQYKDEDYFRVNDLATRDAYDQFLKSNAKKFIFLSSIKAAVDIADVAVSEQVKCNPVTPYGQSKLQAENYIHGQPIDPAKRYYILRPAMIHGEGNKGNLNVLYKFVKAGVPFPFTAFRNQRSFLNIANFNFILDELVKSAIPSGVYHLADSGYLSTTELYRLVAAASGKKAATFSVPKPLVKILFAVTGKTHMLNKLTDNMMVSNAKVVNAIGKQLPVSIQQGITNTIRSFGG